MKNHIIALTITVFSYLTYLTQYVQRIDASCYSGPIFDKQVNEVAKVAKHFYTVCKEYTPIYYTHGLYMPPYEHRCQININYDVSKTCSLSC